MQVVESLNPVRKGLASHAHTPIEGAFRIPQPNEITGRRNVHRPNDRFRCGPIAVQERTDGKVHLPENRRRPTSLSVNALER